MTVRRMPLSEVLATYRPPVGGDTWKRAIPDLLADPDDARIVDLLRAELLEHGDFREPIVVEPAEGDVLNGLHRIVAAVLSEHAALDVADTYEDLPEKRRIQIGLAARPVTSALVDRLTKVLFSFPFAGGWTNCDLLFPGDDELTGWWNCPAGLDEALGAELVGRAAAAGIRLTVISISPAE
ncbi:hypothetical protein [Actinoplanes sp. L3-i22]|uniref:hypothetical protein n=1 Tax=Actinoplanes sp. L3-i22 TaxID=2836373 RepID=UPI001C84D44D|nr:hypothetical protein [Actinoplanes sp. L3-i22]